MEKFRRKNKSLIFHFFK